MWFTRIICLFLICLSFKGVAQPVQFTVEVSANNIALNEVVQVQYTIANGKNVTAFNPPIFKNFQVAQGPDQGSGWSMVNGVMKEYISVSYILQPTKIGSFTIPSATATVSGKAIRSNAATVVVSAAKAKVQPQQSTPNQQLNEAFVLKKGETIKQKIKGNIFLQLDVSKNSCFQGEPIVATYKLYTRLKSESQILHRPSFNGFSVYEMLDPEEIQGAEEVYRGKTYNVYVLRKVQLYPLQSGKLPLDSITVENEISFMEPASTAREVDIFELLENLQNGTATNQGIIKEKHTLFSNTEIIQVNPLPTAPETGFQGAVGNFTISATLENTTIHQNDINKLHIKISGAGNFPMLFVPEVKWPALFNAFEPVSTESYNKTISPIAGDKVFTVPFTVKKQGEYQLLPITFTFFNPATKQYVSVETAPLQLSVLPPSRTIKSTTNGDAPQTNGVLIPLIIIGVLAVILLVIGIFTYKKTKKNTETPIEYTENNLQTINISGDTKKEFLTFKLKRLQESMENNQQNQFYDRLGLLLDFWVKDVQGISDLSQWKTLLAEKGVQPTLLNLVQSLRQEIDIAKYTPVLEEGQMQEAYQKVVFVVSQQS
jgi:hypothetical protein